MLIARALACVPTIEPSCPLCQPPGRSPSRGPLNGQCLRHHALVPISEAGAALSTSIKGFKAGLGLFSD
ncbi:hypothetical protein TcasGA2_TC006812 [Tribolium castaneum]|uniref:Uncharacterized protein n=1 Tax=Tribolium castaneum TaxID=7070 RepID=D6WV94_TRICA|nr:hypothetical protein TcasGA2_TC006812 [Tribolium castaneum]